MDWKTSARRWPEGKAASDLQPTCYLWAESQLGHDGTGFRFEVVTKTKSPVCERHSVLMCPSPAGQGRDAEFRRHHLVGVSLGDQLEHLALAGGELD